MLIKGILFCGSGGVTGVGVGVGSGGVTGGVGVGVGVGVGSGGVIGGVTGINIVIACRTLPLTSSFALTSP